MIPIIQSKGNFKAIAPFNLVNQNYTCVGLRSISSLILDAVDVYLTYYAPHGLTKENYDNAVANNETIVTLQSEGLEIFNVPSSYLSNDPIIPIVPYSNMFITIPLGLIPDTLDLTRLTDSINELVKTNLGIESNSKLVKIAVDKSVDLTTHKVSEIYRNMKLANMVSKLKNTIDLTNKLRLALEQVKRLELIIKQ